MRFELSDLGAQDLKGSPNRSTPGGWACLGDGEPFDANRGASDLTPLVGREEELDLLLRRWSQAKDEEGQVVLLSGEPGIGKSRILNALRERLEAQGVQALRFQCSPYYVNSAFWPDHRQLRTGRLMFRSRRNCGLETRQVGSAGRRALRSALADVRFVAAILSIPFEPRYGALPMTAAEAQGRDGAELGRSRRGGPPVGIPAVMLFEDAHWADPTTLEVLDLLIAG